MIGRSSLSDKRLANDGGSYGHDCNLSDNDGEIYNAAVCTLHYLVCCYGSLPSHYPEEETDLQVVEDIGFCAVRCVHSSLVHILT